MRSFFVPSRGVWLGPIVGLSLLLPSALSCGSLPFLNGPQTTSSSASGAKAPAATTSREPLADTPPGEPAPILSVCEPAPKPKPPRQTGACKAAWDEFRSFAREFDSTLSAETAREIRPDMRERMQVIKSKIRARCAQHDDVPLLRFEARMAMSFNAIRAYQSVFSMQRGLNKPHSQKFWTPLQKSQFRDTIADSAADCARLFRQFGRQDIGQHLVPIAKRCEGWASAHLSRNPPNAKCAEGVAQFDQVLHDTTAYLARAKPADIVLEWRQRWAKKLGRSERGARKSCGNKKFAIMKQVTRAQWLQRKGAALEQFGRALAAAEKRSRGGRKVKLNPVVAKAAARTCTKAIARVTCLDAQLAVAHRTCARAAR